MSSKSPDQNTNNFKEWATIGAIALMGAALLGIAYFVPDISLSAKHVLKITGWGVEFTAGATAVVYLLQLLRSRN